MAQVEVFRGQARRRWSEADKRRLVAETLAVGGTVHGVARRYGINTSQLFTWRKQLRTGADRPTRPAAVPGFAAVTIASPAAFSVPSPAAETVSSGAPASSGLIEIELPDGRTGADRGRSRSGGGRSGATGSDGAMIPIPSGVRVWLATGRTDMRRGMNGLALQVQEVLKRDPYGGHLFVFRGRRGDLIKVLWHDTQGTCLFAKRLERGRFIWPSPAEGVVTITPAQLGYLLEGIDWRHPQRSWRPERAG